MIYGNTVGGAVGPSSIDKTFIIEDSDRKEFVGVVVKHEIPFTAKAADIRSGKTAATQTGVTVGTMK